jgi:hypothetical protein
MANYVVSDASLTAIADAIREKGDTTDPLTFPDGFATAIGNIKTGGSASVAEKAVNFRDYDGTCVYSYTADEFAALTAMPDNPDHSHDAIPLTSQGWNWSLEKAQAYVAKYGRLEVGQMYITTDGKTHVLIHLEQGRTSPMLGCCPNGTVDVDWGDGTEHNTLTGASVTTVKWTPTHNYAAPGDYDIRLTVTGSIGFYGSSSNNQYSGLLRYASGTDSRNRVYLNAIQRVNIGRGVTSLNSDVFYNCYSLSSVSIPDSVTSISVYVFYNCYSMSSIIIPDSVTSIASYAFYNCYSLSSISIPDSVTELWSNVFQNCYGISSISIPDSVTSLKSNVFQNCYGISSISIPDSVTSIESNAFQNCYGISEYHFARTTPPTLVSTSAFTGIVADCVMYVPYSEDHSILAAYKAASNWSTYANYMQEEPQA